MAIWQNVNLTKCQVDEMSSWRNVKLMKCQVDEMSRWRNVKLMKCHIDKLMRCQVVEMSSWKNVVAPEITFRIDGFSEAEENVIKLLSLLPNLPLWSTL